MTRAWMLASVTAVAGFVVVACGGSSDSGLFGSSGDATSSSGAASSSGTTASSSGTTSSGGSSGTTTSSGGSSGGSSGAGDSGVADSGVDSGFDSGIRGCNANDPTDCLQGEYCKLTSCAAKGVCTKKPANIPDSGPIVCGCDGVTYWNEQLAASFGVSVKNGGICQGGSAKTCGDFTDCPNDRYCNRQTSLQASVCVLTNGTCWGVPPQCPNVTGGRAKQCNSGSDTCITFCEAVKAEKPWFEEQAQKCN